MSQVGVTQTLQIASETGPQLRRTESRSHRYPKENYRKPLPKYVSYHIISSKVF